MEIPKEDSLNPEGAIFSEVDALMNELFVALNVRKPNKWIISKVRGAIDSWVKRRVVRFQSSTPADLKKIIENKEYQNFIEELITKQMALEIAQMCGIGEARTDEGHYSLTFYILAFRENF